MISKGAMRKFLLVLPLATIALFFGVFRENVFASASLYTYPSSGTYYQGNSFSVGIYVSSSEAINAVEATISYDSSILSIVSCGVVTSTFELAADSTCPSITVGTTGSYTGSGAQVATVTFRSIATGTASVTVTGKTAINGAYVSTNGATSTFSIVLYTPIPQAPTVSSTTHPKSDKWYKTKTFKASWNKDSGVSGFSYNFDQKKDTIPDNTIDTSSTTISLNVNKSGTWFFHIKAFGSGGWGDPSHYKFLVDSKDPLFVTNPSFEDKGDLQSEIVFKAEDEESGIKNYKLLIDGDEVKGTISSPYKTPVLSVGEHTVVIKAFDKAGNLAQESISITVGDLQPPTVTELAVSDVFIGEVSRRITVKGTAPSEARVFIEFTSLSTTREVTAGKDGLWEYVYQEDFPDGEHSLRVKTSIGGVESSFSEPYHFSTSEASLPFLPTTGAASNKYKLFLIVGGILLGGVLASGIMLGIRFGREKKLKVQKEDIA
jgi:hypothetical protein